MRIIAGTHRGRKLVAPEGLVTRPMTDRVRENLFNILGPHLEDAVVLDLFCGSGALGLETLSRGADFCLFVDADPEAVKATETNATTLRLSDEMRIVRRDALRPGTWIKAPGGTGYTVVFADPPYRLTADEAGRQRLAEMAKRLADLGCLAPGAVAMLRAKRGVPMDRPWPGFNLFDERTYGTTTLYLMEYAGTNI